VHWHAVIGLGNAGREVVKGMIAGRHALGVVAHQVGHDGPDAVLLVIQHDRSAALVAHAQLQWSFRIFTVERYALELVGLIDDNILVIEKHHVGGGLACHALAHGTMAGVVVNRGMLQMTVNVFASSGVFLRHLYLLAELSFYPAAIAGA